jgi:ankyrin repeat protein
MTMPNETTAGSDPAAYSAAMSAIARRDLPMLAEILDAGLHPDLRPENNDPTLMVAALTANFIEGAQLLVRKGAAITSVAPDQAPPLTLAARYRDPAALKFCCDLLDAGALIDEVDQHRRTALFQAAAFGNVDTCQLLIERGAQLDVETSEASTALKVVAGSSLPESNKILRMLLRAGADPAVVPKTIFISGLSSQRSAFQTAVMLGRTENVRIMLHEFKCDPEQRTTDGRSMLDIAGHADVIKLIHAAITERSIAMALDAPCTADAHEPPVATSNSHKLGML